MFSVKSSIEFTLQVLHCLKDCSAKYRLQWLAAVVAVFIFFTLYTELVSTGVTVTSMLVNVTLMLTWVWFCWLINIKYQINSKYQNKTHTVGYIDVTIT